MRLDWRSQISSCLVPQTTLLGTKVNMVCTLLHEEPEAKGRPVTSPRQNPRGGLAGAQPKSSDFSTAKC